MRRCIFLLGICVSLVCADAVSQKYVRYLQNLPAKTKKYRFFKLVLPPVRKVDKELRALYLQTKRDIEAGTHKKRIRQLMRSYKAKDSLDLLKRIKPHPLSITLAQAAIESAWGTSRFFVEANNVFGMWSYSSDPSDSINASKTREGGKTVRLKRYKSIEDSIRAYYKNLATNSAYRCFRQARYYNDNPYELVVLLHHYSEKGELYPIELIKIIKHNNLTRYDPKEPLPRYIEYIAAVDDNSSEEKIVQNKKRLAQPSSQASLYEE